MTMTLFTRLFGKHTDLIHDNRFKLLFLSNANGALGILIVAPILDSLTGPFAVSASRIGLMTTMYTAPGVFMIPLIGALADRYGRKPTLVAGLLLFGAAGTAITLTTDFQIALGLRLLQGVGFAGIIPTVVTSIGDIYEGSKETTAQGLQFAALGLSTSIFSMLAGFLIVLGWRYPLYLYVGALPVAAMVFLWFEEPMQRSQSTSTNEVSTRRMYAHDLMYLMANRRTVSLLLARGVPSFIYVGFLTYCSFTVVEAIDGTPQQAGIIVGLASIVNAAASTQAGRVTGHFGNRVRLLVWTNVLMGLGMVAFGLVSSFAMAMVSALVLGIGFGLTSGLYRSVITSLVPMEFRGGLVSVSESVGRLAATIAPILVGTVITLGTPLLGYSVSIRWAIVGAGLFGGVCGVFCLVIAEISPPNNVTTTSKYNHDQ